LDAFEFHDLDRIPVACHTTPVGLYVHGQMLLDLFNEFQPENPITFVEHLDLGTRDLWTQITLFEKYPGFADKC
jgi:hypothetical protein